MTAQEQQVQDRIERRIAISATADRVWAIVSEPGWWINGGSLVEHRIEDRGDGLVVVHDDAHGSFFVRTERLEPPRRAVFAWSGGHRDVELADGTTTTVELLIEDVPEGVVLTVVESGFAALNRRAEVVARDLDQNASGWASMLDLVAEAA